MQLKLKILLVGPSRVGKSFIANFLSDCLENSSKEYKPTHGVRIVEFEAEYGKRECAEIELWDCSGNHRYETCWPAISRDAIGVVFVYNPDEVSHAEELDRLYTHFVENAKLKENQCFVLCYNKPDSSNDRCRLSSRLRKLDQSSCSLDSPEDGKQLRADFNKFAEQLSRAISKKREQDELNIMN